MITVKHRESTCDFRLNYNLLFGTKDTLQVTHNVAANNGLKILKHRFKYKEKSHYFSTSTS